MACETCGQQFRKYHARHKFCSKPCQNTEAHKEKKRRYVFAKRNPGAAYRPMSAPTSCPGCGTKVAHQSGCHRYCSRNCQHRHYRKENPEWFQQHDAVYTRVSRTKWRMRRPWKYLFASRLSHARKRGLPFALTNEWATQRWTGRCELTGIPFAPQGNGPGPQPLSPSIDRIDQRKGYTPDNCRFVLWAVNALHGVGSDETMYAVAAALITRRKTSVAPVGVHDLGRPRGDAETV